MFKPFSLFVGLRYTLTRKRNFFLSFVSLISMLGVTLGVLILIVAMSVMNGSISTLRREALKSVPHVTVSGDAITADWEQQAALAILSEEVLAVAPYMEGEATLRYQGENIFVRLRGVQPLLEADVVSNPGQRYRDLLRLLDQTANGIVLGTQLAGSLGIYGSGEVSVTTLGSLLARSLSDSQGFRVVGFADFGIYGNNNIALINLNQARQLFQQDSGTDLQLRLRVSEVFEADRIASEAFAGVDGLTIQPWNEAQASLFNALKMEKFLTSFMLLMIVIIGAVNIVSIADLHVEEFHET